MRKVTYLILLVFLMAGMFLAGSWYNQHAVTRSSAVGRKVLHYACPMHPQYTSDRPGDAPCCGMRLDPVYAEGGPAVSAPANTAPSRPPGAVSISPERQQLIGVRVSRVERTSGTRMLRLFGRVVPDEATAYRLTAGVDGWIGQVSPVTTGSQVEKDQLLATYSTPDLFQSSQAYLFALTGTDRLKPGAPENPQINPVNSNFRQRIERLHSLGMSNIQIEELRRTRLIPETIKIFAPAKGFVLARNVSPGQRFDKGAEWFRIADLSRVWILADVYADDAQHLSPGVRAQVSLPNQRTTLSARVSEVLPQFDAATRTLKVRLESVNPGYVLRPDMFVDAELPITLPSTIAVPVDAVLDSGLKKTVFVDSGDGLFEPRSVETGRRFNDRVEIVNGLRPGEQIVVSAAFLIDSESRMRAAAPAVHEDNSEDPICGMKVDVAKAKAAGRTNEHQGRTYYFCSDHCKQSFSKDVMRYVTDPRVAVLQPAGLK